MLAALFKIATIINAFLKGAQFVSGLFESRKTKKDDSMLKLGSKGAQVIELQKRLNEAGFPCGTIDGDFGPLTVTAVKAFQASKSLAVDGIAGPNTMRVLNAPSTTPTPVIEPGPLNARSLKNLEQVDERLVQLAHELAKVYPIIVICGHRNQADQDAAFRGGFSKLKWPNSAHNKLPSRAIDTVPSPVDWKDIKRFEEMRSHAYAIADRLGIKLDPTISWDRPHLELS